ncbi:hypothetical protein QLS71_006350 [Mariniflexile litorale]|uniref:Secreted protein (Por secretion system target) n=1 Tax=Mariniflexile litorale TaxID=3045158 RepID=A0AAU7EJJ3_9FLAO|nr:hypothetical protein [Mariniflexile sp. KMM 9835]MDQ8211431.1 hypothetical protein [Mariniflexile sp. KMM 9835]
MKNVLNISKKGILMVTMFATLLSSANESSFNTIKDDAKKTALTLTDVKAGNQLSIKDANGIVLYTELIQKSGIYAKGFDLTSLPNGAYVFELDKEVEIKTIPFIINQNNIVVYKSKQTTNFKPHLTQKGNLLFVSKLSPNLEAVRISVYSNNNSEYELLHSEKITDVQIAERVYKLEKGNYKIIINSDNKEFTKFINN